MKLKPSTIYDFSDEDLAVAIELAKIGSVRLLSNQVTLKSDKNAGLLFKDSSENDNKKLEGLKLPQNWVIEWIGASDGCASITFRILN